MFRSVGSGTGPTTFAPVRVTCSTISRAATSSIRWSYARSLILMRGPATACLFSVCLGLPLRCLSPVYWTTASLLEPRLVELLDDLHDSAGADGAATLSDGEPQALLHR